MSSLQMRGGRGVGLSTGRAEDNEEEEVGEGGGGWDSLGLGEVDDILKDCVNCNFRICWDWREKRENTNRKAFLSVSVLCLRWLVGFLASTRI